MGVRAQRTPMSVEPRNTMGLAHVTVVPENFEAVEDGDGDDDGDGMDVPSDPRVPRHR